MKEVMGTKVSIASKGNGKGKIEIEYYSDEELERMFDMIMSIERKNNMESKILNALGIDPAFIFLFMLILFVVLFILYVNVTMKYNRLKNSYATFMKGKDGKSLEQSLKDKFEEAEAVLKFTKQNRTEIRELNRKLETNYQKVGIVKYDAFNEMGGN